MRRDAENNIRNELDIRIKMTETDNQSQATSTNAGDDGEAVAGSEGYVAENGFTATEPMHWYVACVRVNYEKKFEIIIGKDFKDKKLALETWIPLKKRIAITSRGKRVVRETVILTTFVFVRVEDRNLNEIRFRSDVYKMLSEPGKYVPCKIPDKQIEDVRRTLEQEEAEILNHAIKKGDKVRVIGGNLIGVIAYVQRVQAKKVVIATEIPNILGAAIEISRDHIEYIK